jgi:5-methylcytosine-specific restriction endonuclease McrA
MPKSFVRSRSLAFARQGYRCYYCTSPMWGDNVEAFATKYRLTLAQAKRFECTGEHLVALQDGGNHSEANVVAACLYCNRHRHHHRPKAAPSPEAYQHRVQKQMKEGRWFGAQLLGNNRVPACDRAC